MATKTAEASYYVVTHSMIGVPGEARNDPALSQSIDAAFLLKGDVVPAAMLAGQHPRLLRLGAIRVASTDEADTARASSRFANNEADAQDAANSTVTPPTTSDTSEK